MLFPTHLVAGYGLGKYLDVSLIWVVIGAALPDVIDKTLGIIGVIDLYQSIGHSFLPVIGLSVLTVRRRAWLPILIGWVSHLFLDATHMLLNGRGQDIVFLAWPLVDHKPAVNLSPIEFFYQYIGTPSFYVEFLIWIGVGYLYFRSNNGT